MSSTLSGGDTLFIAEGASRNVKIHPAVLFAVLDHYIRRNEGQSRVIGTLLGVVDEVTGCVEVTDCFAVQHSDKQDEVFLDKKFQQTMSELHYRVNPKETIVGWYATSMEGGAMIVDSSSLIHDFYASECEDPIHLVVDTALTGDHVGVKAFVSTPLAVAGIELANMFHQVKVEVHASEPERICLDRMVAGDSATATSEDLSGAGHQLASLENSMQKLLEMMETASGYVDGVVEGNTKADDETGRRIADTLASVPRIRPEVFDKIFNDNLQDLLMVSYLSSLTKSQLAIAERLNASI
eukprot:CAMPEP_0172587806 /NCGR_PEP_ID=MMETSP1068-20121228/6809_1 /TAXON_ID=35684 /ORGANISM="Pseudopedinella elastica, Strain CCMP716" /LENGTH=296 /DNA_ID=CAMNT_0013382951 /DNA_START=26 /DNA_END=916 /DNA_ORIENTATION=+